MCRNGNTRSEDRSEGYRWPREDWRELRKILREDRKAGGAPEEWKPTVCWTLVLQSRQRSSSGAKEGGGGEKTMEAND